jgi:hypothetical protein
MSEPTEHQMAVSSLLDALSRRTAVLAHNERVANGEIYVHGCACAGRMGNDPLCGCAMQYAHKVGQCWYKVNDDGAEYVCRVGFVPVRRY